MKYLDNIKTQKSHFNFSQAYEHNLLVMIKLQLQACVVIFSLAHI